MGGVAEGLIVLLLLSLRLDTRFDATGIHYRMSPLHFKWQYIEWAQVSQVYLREYDPLSEYGGWGLKGLVSNRAYNVAGSTGLQLVLHTGQRILIGTQQPDEIRQLLQQLAVTSQPI